MSTARSLADNERREVLRGAGAQWGARLAGQAMGFLLTVILARGLGVADFGRLMAVASFTGIVTSLTDLGLPFIAAREAARDPRRLTDYVGTLAIGRLVLSLPAYAVAVGVAVALFHADPVTTRVAVIRLLSLAPFALTSSLTIGFQVRLRMATAGLIEVAARLIGLLGTLAALALGGGLIAVVVVSTAAAMIHPLMLWWAGRDSVGLRLHADRSLLVTLLTRSLALGAAVVLNGMYLRADTVLLAVLQPASVVGEYAASYRVMEAALVLPSVIGLTVLPVLSRHAGRPGQFRASVDFAMRLSIGSILPLALVLAVFARPLVTLVGGSGFAAAAGSLRVLSLAAVATSADIVIGLAIIAIDRQRQALWLNAAGLLLNVGLNFVLIPRLGGVGAAAATVVGEGLVWVCGSIMLLRWSGFRPPVDLVARLLPPLAGGGLVALATVRVPWMLSATATVATYALLAAATGGLPVRPSHGASRAEPTNVDPISSRV